MAKVSIDAIKITAKKTLQNNKTLFGNGSNHVALVSGMLVGVVVSVPVSLMLVSSMIKTDVVSSGSTNKTMSMAPASDVLSCVAPVSAAIGSGKQSTTPLTYAALSSTKPSIKPNTAPPAYSSKPTTQFVTKLVGGVYANNTATVSNNAPNSKVVVVDSNTITNTNVSEESNSTTQNATTGNVNVNGNIGATANASSGSSNNTNSTSFNEESNN